MSADPVRDKLAVALDVNGFEQAKTLVEQLAPYVGTFKFGSDLDECVALKTVAELIHANGCKVFLDDKFHDTPDRVARKARMAARLNADFFTTHALGLKKCLVSAVENRGASNVIAVTVLTSHGNAELNEYFLDCLGSYWPGWAFEGPDTAMELAAHLIRNEVIPAVAQGIVTSALDLEKFNAAGAVSSEYRRLFKITPGIRPSWAGKHDHERIATPSEAIRAGADLLVIGRPITNPPSGLTPLESVTMIREEMRFALAGRKA
jgi:orotidine-5'-phosphate decarboxylase